MPALPVVPGVIKLEWLWTQGGIPAANVSHVKYTGGPPAAADLAGFGAAMIPLLWPSGLYSGYSTSTILVGMKLTDLASDTGAVAESSSGQAGTFSGDELPAQAAVLVNFAIGRRYRGGHPRMYFPPPTQSLLAGPSEWAGTLITELGSRFTALFAYYSGGTEGTTVLAGPVNVSYKTAGAPRVSPVVDPITGFTVNPIMATQRRRIRASSY